MDIKSSDSNSLLNIVDSYCKNLYTTINTQLSDFQRYTPYIDGEFHHNQPVHQQLVKDLGNANTAINQLNKTRPPAEAPIPTIDGVDFFYFKCTCSGVNRSPLNDIRHSLPKTRQFIRLKKEGKPIMNTPSPATTPSTTIATTPPTNEPRKDQSDSVCNSVLNIAIIVAAVAISLAFYSHIKNGMR